MQASQAVPAQPISGFEEYSSKESSRRTLYTVSFIFMLLEVVLVGIIGLAGISLNLSRILTIDNGWKPLLIFLKTVPQEEWWNMKGWKEIWTFIFLAFHALQLISLFWLVPMTVINYKGIKNVSTKKEKKHLVLGICTLLFTGNLISGILLIVASAQAPDYKRKS